MLSKNNTKICRNKSTSTQRHPLKPAYDGKMTGLSKRSSFGVKVTKRVNDNVKSRASGLRLATVMFSVAALFGATYFAVSLYQDEISLQDEAAMVDMMATNPDKLAMFLNNLQVGE